MSFQFECPKCQKTYSAKDADAGRNVTCKKCGTRFQVEAPQPEPEESVVTPEPTRTGFRCPGCKFVFADAGKRTKCPRCSAIWIPGIAYPGRAEGLPWYYWFSELVIAFLTVALILSLFVAIIGSVIAMNNDKIGMSFFVILPWFAGIIWLFFVLCMCMVFLDIGRTLREIKDKLGK